MCNCSVFQSLYRNIQCRCMEVYTNSYRKRLMVNFVKTLSFIRRGLLKFERAVLSMTNRFWLSAILFQHPTVGKLIVILSVLQIIAGAFIIGNHVRLRCEPCHASTLVAVYQIWYNFIVVYICDNLTPFASSNSCIWVNHWVNYFSFFDHRLLWYFYFLAARKLFLFPLE